MTEQPGTPRNPVKEVRQALDFSRHQMAGELGCMQTLVWYWEEEALLPRQRAVMNNLRKLAKQAGIQIEQ